MAARQFLPDRGADPHRAPTPAAGLQPRAAASSRRPVGRLAARIRHRARNGGAWRRPCRSGKPGQFRHRLPKRDRADHGRIVGDSDHAAFEPDREPAARGRTHRRGSCRPQSRRFLGRPDGCGMRHRSEELSPGDGRHGALRHPAFQFIRRRVRAPPAGPEPGAGDALDLDRPAPGRIRPDHRAHGAVGKPAAGGRSGIDFQQHRRPALFRGDGLARVRRDHERGRAQVARGSGRRL